MKIRTTVKHELAFSVYDCWPEEGGMGDEQFGDTVYTLEEAVVLFDLASATRKDNHWFIRCEVVKTVVPGDGKEAK